MTKKQENSYKGSTLMVAPRKALTRISTNKSNCRSLVFRGKTIKPGNTLFLVDYISGDVVTVELDRFETGDKHPLMFLVCINDDYQEMSLYANSINLLYNTEYEAQYIANECKLSPLFAGDRCLQLSMHTSQQSNISYLQEIKAEEIRRSRIKPKRKISLKKKIPIQFKSLQHRPNTNPPQRTEPPLISTLTTMRYNRSTKRMKCYVIYSTVTLLWLETGKLYKIKECLLRR